MSQTKPRTTHPAQKHVPKLQQNLSILDRPHQPSSVPWIRQSWKIIVLDCKGLLLMMMNDALGANTGAHAEYIELQSKAIGLLNSFKVVLLS